MRDKEPNGLLFSYEYDENGAVTNLRWGKDGARDAMRAQNAVRQPTQPADGRSEYFRRYIPQESPEGHVAFENEIFRVTVGSELHDTGLEGSEDHDEMGIFIEPDDHVLGFKKKDHYTHRTAGKDPVTGRDNKSQPGDIDLVLYSLRKYISLAVQGNPTVILLLFAPPEHVIYSNPLHDVQGLAPYIVSKRAAPRYLGYMEAQRQRFTGEKRGHTPSRPDLIERFGYDTKYASHAVRLGLQGIELMNTGRLTLPMGEDGDVVRAIRRGEYGKEDVTDLIADTESDLKVAVDRSTLNDEPDFETLERWLIDTHIYHWGYL